MSPGKLLFCLLLLLSVVSVNAATELLLVKLRSDYAALVAAEQDFHAQRERATLQGGALTDYAAYVARLHRQVAEGCAAVSARGIPVPADISCPTSPAVMIAPASVDQAGERTSREQTTDLEAELFSGMSEFDEMLLREQQRIKAATPHAEGGGGGGAGGGRGGEAGEADGGEEGGDADGGEEGGGAGNGDGDTAAGEQTADGRATGASGGGGQQPASDGAPPGTPDGSDDNLVARQLREMAEQQTDPVLKKKYWEEYRRYKESTAR